MTRAHLNPGPAIGRAAKVLREQQGRGLRETARAVGISPSYLHNFESGNVDNPSLGTVMAVAAELGTTVAELIGEATQANIRTAEVEVLLRRALRTIGREALAAASGDVS